MEEPERWLCTYHSNRGPEFNSQPPHQAAHKHRKSGGACAHQTPAPAPVRASSTLCAHLYKLLLSLTGTHMVKKENLTVS